MVGGLRARRQPDRPGADGLGHVGEERGELVVALDRDRRAVERRDRPLRVGERDQRMERADLRPGRHRRGEHLGVERAARVDHGLAAVHAAGSPASGAIASSGTARMMSSTSSTRACGLGEGADAVDERAEPLAPARVAARDRLDRPAGARQGDAERRPDRPGADDADDRRLARLGVRVRVLVVARVDLVAVAVEAGRRRVEVDARPPRWRPRSSARARRVRGRRPGRSRQALIGGRPRGRERSRYASTRRV